MARGLRQLGPYVITDRIASGGMASVYLAQREGPGGFVKPVALKVLHPHLSSDSDAVQMFEEEAQLGARFNHANLVSVFDSGVLDSYYYLAMEYYAGVSLADIGDALEARGDRLEPECAVALVRDILDGLDFAHRLKGEDKKLLGVIHRDISPDNILLTDHGEVRILDFGIAAGPERRPKSRLGIAKGKLAYMAPEQLSGASVDKRADLYATAVVAFELLTGDRLFDDGHGGRRIDPEEALDRVAAELEGTDELRDTLQKSLALKPTARFRTARKMATALGDTVAEQSADDRRAQRVALVKWTRAYRNGDLPQRGYDIEPDDREVDPDEREVESKSPRPRRAPRRRPLATATTSGGALAMAEPPTGMAAAASLAWFALFLLLAGLAVELFGLTLPH